MFILKITVNSSCKKDTINKCICIFLNLEICIYASWSLACLEKKVSYLCFPARIFLDQTPGERGGAAEGREQGPNHITQSVSDQFLKKGVHRKIMMERERENIFLVKDLHFPSCSLVLSTPSFNLNLQCCL